jgi:hypothetical protein
LTVQFRTDHEFVDSLKAARFRVDGVREVPDRPRKEYVFLAAQPLQKMPPWP